MNEGARSREPRREEDQSRRDAEQFETLANALAPITSAEQFEVLVNGQPALFGRAMLDSLQRLADDPTIQPFVTESGNLVERAHSEPVSAWRAFKNRRWTKWSGKHASSSQFSRTSRS